MRGVPNPWVGRSTDNEQKIEPIPVAGGCEVSDKQAQQPNIVLSRQRHDRDSFYEPGANRYVIGISSNREHSTTPTCTQEHASS